MAAKSSGSAGAGKTKSPSKSSSTSKRTKTKKENIDDFDDELSNFDFEDGIHDDNEEEKPAKKSSKSSRSKKEEASDQPASEGSSEESSNDSRENSGSEGSRRKRNRPRRRSNENRSSNNSGNSGGRRRGGNNNRNRGGNNSNRGGRSRGRRSNRSNVESSPDVNIEEITGTIEGVLELHPKGYGFLRDEKKNYASQASDAFVSSSVIEKYKLREGVKIRGEVGPGTRGQGPRLKEIESVDGRTLDEYAKIRFFDDLTAINPFEQITLERGPRPITMRVMDLMTPIGKGQRALIVAPPRTGKTMLLQDIAESVTANHPEVKLMVLLIDERPEEVTEMKRNVRGEVIASSMDRDVESHVRISQLIIERGKRLAEAGQDVFILLDSITRTARAFNKWVGNTGRTMSGGLDVKALDIPKKMFGTARRFDEGGSLTVCATALIDTGSRMDEVIFQEFKGTGNMELVLSRDLADRRIWPAIDITKSGTRREEKILNPDVLDGTIMLRRSLVSLNPIEAMEQLTRTLERFPSNSEFLTKIKSVL